MSSFAWPIHDQVQFIEETGRDRHGSPMRFKPALLQGAEGQGFGCEVDAAPWKLQGLVAPGVF